MSKKHLENVRIEMLVVVLNAAFGSYSRRRAGVWAGVCGCSNELQ